MKEQAKSRTPNARRERAAVRRFFRAALRFIEIDSATDPIASALITQRFAVADRALSRVPGYKTTTIDIETCTPGHAADCLTSDSDDCSCACGGKNHGKLTSKSTTLFQEPDHG